MDTGMITTLITAISAGIAAVIGAVALLRRASVPNSKARQALEALWQWLEAHDLVGQVPDRTKRRVLQIIDADDHEESKL
jgi:hypothetical protein